MTQSREALAALQQGAQCHKNGDLDGATALYRRVLELSPDQADALHLLGMIASDKGDWPSAANLISRATQMVPDHPLYNLHLAPVLRQCGRLFLAAQVAQRAVALAPDNPLAHFNLGRIYQEQLKWAQAADSYRRTLSLKPDMAPAHNNLGWSLKQMGRLGPALDSFRESLRLAPGAARTINNIASTLKDQGNIAGAIDEYRRALKLDKTKPGLHSNLLFALNYHGTLTREEIFAEHLRWAKIHADHLAPSGTARKIIASKRPLRVGYVSGDFRGHSVGFFIESIISHHNQRDGEFEIHCYSDVATDDAVTHRLRASCQRWHSIVGQTDADVSRKISDDGIDILVDLAGHTGTNRLLVFARRPAPVQVTYLGYPHTTGLATIDFRFTDAASDPPGQSDSYHSEKLWRLPRGFLCYTPPKDAPAPADLPSRNEAHVTFGSFNNISKVTDDVVRTWSNILRKVPRSRLLLKSRSLVDEGTANRYRGLFAAEGIDGSRLQLVGHEHSLRQHLSLYDRVDIALDPFPYNGTTTTCEALWMGVPVITLRGDRHSGRVGVSLLQCVGAFELIADSRDQYVKLAAELAGNTAGLAHYRASLRPAMLESPLLDAKGFAEQIESAYRQMWESSADKTCFK